MVDPSTGRTLLDAPLCGEVELPLAKDRLLELAERVSWRGYEIDPHAVAEAMLARPCIVRRIALLEASRTAVPVQSGMLTQVERP